MVGFYMNLRRLILWMSMKHSFKAIKSGLVIFHSIGSRYVDVQSYDCFGILSSLFSHEHLCELH